MRAKLSLSWLYEMFWPRNEPAIRVQVVISILLVAVSKAVILAAPFLYKMIVDTLSAPEAIIVPAMLILAYGAARLVAQSVDDIRQMTFIRVAQRAIRLIATRVFRHLHALSLRFHLDRKSGGVVQIVARGTGSMEFLVELVVFQLVPTAIELIAVVIILAGVFDIGYAAVTLATLGAYLALTMIGARRQTNLRRETNALDAKASIRILDSLINYETVKYLSAEEIEVDRYDCARRLYAQSVVRSKLVETAFGLSKAAVLAAGTIVIMLMAARGVADGRMTIGDFVMVNAFLLQLYAPLEMIATVYGSIRQAHTDTEMMLDLLSITTDVHDAPNAQPLVIDKGKVTFENVSFAYDPRRPILHNVSFEIPAGHRVAIVGPSGSGKSTIARLLFRFYDVSGGRITIDGYDVRTVTQDSLRRAIGVVPQDTVLFNDSVSSNIAYGASKADAAEIVAAARAASIHDAIERLPDGYQSIVGERGLKLSGGEKQRIAIARTVMKDPSILILDEATSALDTRTEREIQSSLDRLTKNRSTLIIAHRLSTVVNADEILVLTDGQIVERGTHRDLLNAGGFYAAMWAHQQHEEEYASSRHVEAEGPGTGPFGDPTGS